MISTLEHIVPLHQFRSFEDANTEGRELSDDSTPSTSSSASSSSSTLPLPESCIHTATAIVRSKNGLLKGDTFGVCFSGEGDMTFSLHSRHAFDAINEHFPASPGHLNALSSAGLRPIIGKVDKATNCTTYIIERPPVLFPPISTVRSLSSTPGLLSPPPANIPTLEEWENLWKIWDLITLQMIPSHMLHQKPVDLRHKCLFYIGHIPTFLDMLLSKAIGGGPTEPKQFWNIFERGIDPHVDDPDHCHNHSDVPEKDEDWPVLETIVKFRDGVRKRLAGLYADLQTGKRRLTRNIARTLVMTHEHEGWHVETLLYMLIQRAGTGTLPPPGFATPPWNLLSKQWNRTPLPSTTSVVVGPANIVMGHNDSEADDFNPAFEHAVDDHEFGWDNESPVRTVQVAAFRVDWRPITNKEFLAFLEGEGKDKVPLPKTWENTREVKTMYGPVSMDVAQNWPVLTSYDDLATYARSKGGRLPTEPELRLFLDMYDVGHEGGANVAFRSWHPVPATTGISADGRGSNGSVWEWTSSVFEAHDGLVPTKLFPGYSEDFFDTKHQVVLGASYATIPRLCRRTVRNFYQHNYPYAWVGARVAYDL